MDSGNSGSISSSGDEEYDSRTNHHHQTLLPSNFLNQQPTLQFGSISHTPHSSLQPFNPSSNPVSFFDLSPNYLHNLSQSQQPNINPNSFQNLNSQTSQQVSSSSSQNINQCLLTTPHQALGIHDDENNNARNVLSSPTTTTNVARNSKKRTRASRRAPTTVLTTDTSNFRAMVQEFTGIPAPPFSSSSYSRRLDLLTSSSSLRSSSSHFDSTSSFYPLRPSQQKLHQNHPNPLPSSSTLLHNNNMVDSTTNNYQLPSDLGLPYNHHHQHNFMLSMQNQQPILPFNNPSSSSHQFNRFSLGGFGAKSQSVQSLEDLGVKQGQQVNAHLVATGHDDDDGRCLDHESYGGGKVVGSSSSGGGVGSNCKVSNFSGSASTTLNHDKNLENNNNNSSNRGGEGGGVDSWICSSD